MEKKYAMNVSESNAICRHLTPVLTIIRFKINLTLEYTDIAEILQDLTCREKALTINYEKNINKIAGAIIWHFSRFFLNFLQADCIMITVNKNFDIKNKPICYAWN